MLAWGLRSHRALQKHPALLISTHGDATVTAFAVDSGESTLCASVEHGVLDLCGEDRSRAHWTYVMSSHGWRYKGCAMRF